METETETRPAPEVTEPDRWNRDNDAAAARLVVYTTPNHSQSMHLRADELQAIVQQAYDVHGIMAEPSLEREGARLAEAAGEAFTELAESLQAAHNAGARA